MRLRPVTGCGLIFPPHRRTGNRISFTPRLSHIFIRFNITISSWKTFRTRQVYVQHKHCSRDRLLKKRQCPRRVYIIMYYNIVICTEINTYYSVVLESNLVFSSRHGLKTKSIMYNSHNCSRSLRQAHWWLCDLLWAQSSTGVCTARLYGRVGDLYSCRGRDKGMRMGAAAAASLL